MDARMKHPRLLRWLRHGTALIDYVDGDRVHVMVLPFDSVHLLVRGCM